MKLGLIKRRECWTLTARAWVALFLVAAGVLAFGFESAFPFLAVNQSVKSDVLVVEGWLPDYSIRQVRAEFEKGGYRLLLTTGGPIIQGEILAEFKTSAELTRAILLKNGFDNSKLAAIPSAEKLRDRTYASAVALRQWLSQSGTNVKSINVFSRGAHARRTRLLFERAFEGQMQIGIIAGEDLRYDGKQWWKTSEGVRDILDEGIAYLYARILFHPK